MIRFTGSVPGDIGYSVPRRKEKRVLCSRCRASQHKYCCGRVHVKYQGFVVCECAQCGYYRSLGVSDAVR